MPEEMFHKKKVYHTFGPCCDEECKILILGTMPSPKSREQGFYYGHPQNIFWKTLSRVLGQPEPAPTLEARRKFVLKNHIALWDVIKSCEIKGAEDGSIQNEIPNDMGEIFRTAPGIQTIFTTGKKAKQLYDKYCDQMFENWKPEGEEVAGWLPPKAVYLPSTSPANRALQNKDMYWDLWRKVGKALQLDKE